MIDVQRTDFVAVPTRDRERAAAFYGEMLGLRKNQTSDTWIEFAPLPFGTVVVHVPDVAAAKEKLEAAGVEFVGEPWDSGVCHGAAFKDPDGNGLALHHRYAPYPDGRQP
jgi:predicted enzyme related to lactoylglutathione lyase